ncbi:MAG: LEA type 2 family protein [Deinococcales bacterium]
MSKASYKNFKVIGLLLFLSFFLSSCVSGLVPQILSPSFRLVALPYVESVSLPIIGSGMVVLRLPVEIYNPNAVSISVDRVDFDVYLNQAFVLNSSFSQGFGLTAQGSRRIDLEVNIPILSSIALAPDIQAMIQGQPSFIRLDGSVTVNVFGLIRVLARTTLLEGRVN